MAEQHYYQTPGHVIAAGIALSLLDILAVAFRFKARRGAKQPLKTDDWLLLPATLLTAGVGICLVYGVSREAFGYRLYTSIETPSTATSNQISVSIRLQWTISLILPFALACTKISFLCFYKRIFSVNKQLNWLLIGLVVVIVLWSIAFFLATLLCCGTMLFDIWKPISEMATCQLFLRVWMAFCITGFVTDLVIICIPIPVIWRLKLSTENKLVGSISFLLGSVTLAASLARLIVSTGFVQVASNPENDFILNATLYCYWGMVECSIGVFAACLPTLQLFFRRSTWQSVASRTKDFFNSGSRSRSMKRVGSTDSQNIHMVHTPKDAKNGSHGSSRYSDAVFAD